MVNENHLMDQSRGLKGSVPKQISLLLGNLWEILGWAAEALFYLWAREPWGPGEGCWSGKAKV